ncbi:MAG: TIGR03663 family protein [Methanomicrobiales archaeon]|jgi:uncharacterized protein (TIGR03663 family)|nr:TIGR03663 family protein [Methanomicrobiales archaeon]
MSAVITSIKERYYNTPTQKIILFIFIIGLFLRIIYPELKLLHHDEAIHAWMSYGLLVDGTYTYDPVYHGPLLYYIMSTAFSIFGDSDAVARLVPGIAGALIIPALYPLYKLDYISKNQVVLVALFFALSPNMVYFSRFLRHDIFQLLFTLLLLVCIFAYFEREKWYFALLAGICGAFTLCLKEEVPIILVFFAVFFIGMWLLGKIEFPKTWSRDIVIAVFAALAICYVLYSSLLSQPDVFFEAASRAVNHWLSIHGECRLCGPPYFYVLYLFIYELPILILAIVSIFIWLFRKEGLVHIVKAGTDYLNGIIDGYKFKIPYQPFDKKELFFILCLYWLAGTMALYGYVGEKVPWLLIHQLFPMLFVAVRMLEELNRKKVILTGICVVWLIILMVHVTFIPAADLSEPIVQVQNSEDLRVIMGLIDASERVALVSTSSWPLPWYYRGDRWSKFLFYAGAIPEDELYGLDPDLVIADYNDEIYPSLEGYTKETYKLSYWFSWYENHDRALAWFFLRDGTLGSLNINVFTRA